MNKCLVTTLKAQTNNETLSKYNVLTIKVNAAEEDNIFAKRFDIATSTNGGISIKSDNIGFLVTSAGQATQPYPIVVAANGSFGAFIEKKDGVIEISNKYNIRSLDAKGVFIIRVRELYGMADGCIDGSLVFNDVEEDEIDATLLMKKIDKTKIKALSYSGNKKVINKNPASVINSLTNLTSNEFSESFFDNASFDDYRDCVNLTIMTHSGYTIPGNLSSLSKMTKLQYIHFDGKKQVSGDFRPLIQAWINNGRTEGKINVTWLLTQANITLDGSAITYPSGVPANSAYLNWTSDGTVTFTAS